MSTFIIFVDLADAGFHHYKMHLIMILSPTITKHHAKLKKETGRTCTILSPKGYLYFCLFSYHECVIFEFESKVL